MRRSAEGSLHVAAHAATAAAAHAAPVSAASVGVARRSAVSVAAAAAARSTPVPPGELHPPPLRACIAFLKSAPF